MTDDAELSAVEPPGYCPILRGGGGFGAPPACHGLCLRLHRTVPAVEGGAATVRPAVGSRNQARRLSVDGAPGWLARPLLHAQRLRLGGPLPGIVDAANRIQATSFLIDGEVVIARDERMAL